MPSVTITPPAGNSMDTPTTGTSLSVIATYDEAVSGFDEMDITNISLAGVSITSVTGATDEATYTLVFQLPSETNSSFTFDIQANAATSTANPSDSGPNTAVTSSRIYFDSRTPTTSTTSTANIIRESGGIIKVPISTGESVRGLSKTHFDIQRPTSYTGANDSFFDDTEYWLEGSGSSYTLTFQLPKNIVGTYTVGVKSNALVYSTNNVQKRLTLGSVRTVNYNTTVPYVENYDMPSTITTGLWDVYVGFNTRVTGMSYSSFISEGINIGTPAAIYRWTSASAVRFDTNVDGVDNIHNDDRIAVPDPIPTNLPDTSGNWTKTTHTQESQYFVLRFHIPTNFSQYGSFNLSLKQGGVLGPRGVDS